METLLRAGGGRRRCDRHTADQSNGGQPSAAAGVSAVRVARRLCRRELLIKDLRTFLDNRVQSSLHNLLEGKIKGAVDATTNPKMNGGADAAEAS